MNSFNMIDLDLACYTCNNHITKLFIFSYYILGICKKLPYYGLF